MGDVGILRKANQAQDSKRKHLFLPIVEQIKASKTYARISCTISVDTSAKTSISVQDGSDTSTGDEYICWTHCKISTTTNTSNIPHPDSNIRE